MLTFVCWRWAPHRGYRSTYGPETVNALKRMVDRWYQKPHRFLCVTDDAAGIDPSVEVVPAWNDFAQLPSPHGVKNPSCYRRLRMFHPAIGQVFGERFVSLDLDVVITGDLSPLVDRPEDFVCWGDTNPQPGSHYNGSMILMTAGSRQKVWTEFDPVRSPKLALQAKCYGSDQGWLSYCLGPHEAKWTKADGVYSFRNHLRKHGDTLPANARVVIWHGSTDPWSPGVAQRYGWVRDHYGVPLAVAS